MDKLSLDVWLARMFEGRDNQTQPLECVLVISQDVGKPVTLTAFSGENSAATIFTWQDGHFGPAPGE